MKSMVIFKKISFSNSNINFKNHQHVMMMFITDTENNNAIILQYIGITVSTFSLQLPSTIIKILIHTSLGLESE